MSVKSNKDKIVKAMRAAGTYREEFGQTIETLAKMIDDCAKAEKAFKDSGGKYITTYTNKAGAENLVKNPHYSLIENLRKDMLTYHSHLGLTPAGLKKINTKLKMGAKKGGLAEMLEKIEK